MTIWFVILVSLVLVFLIKAFLSRLQSFTKTKITNPLPPGPPFIPIITPIKWLTKSFLELESILKTVHAKYGPMVALRIGSRSAIFIADRTLAHQALIQNGSLFADRPASVPINKIISCNEHNISFANYGPIWRVLRRNLAVEMLHPARVKSFTPTRKLVLDVLLNRLHLDSKSNDSIIVKDHLQFGIFSLLVFMCFGQRVDDEKLGDINRVQRGLFLRNSRFNVLNFWPKITKFLFQKRWEEFLKLHRDHKEVFLPLIRERKKAKEAGLLNDSNNPIGYVDTLLDLKLPEDGQRNLNEAEIVTLCAEFLLAGSVSTSTMMQWIMANLVKYQHVQQRLVQEIGKLMALKGIDKKDKEVISEQDLEKLPYIKAVVLEALRRHPPGHFVLTHAVSEDVVLNGYLVPKKGTVNFMVAEMAWDSQVWEDPMAFKPERFLNEDCSELLAFDITGTTEIKMMPFGAGRRICPGYNLALLHLEYFVANLVWNFDWKIPKGRDVDFSEKQEFTITMKNPLWAHISPRIHHF
ncbi:PREDICTED: cytochrome P450 89A2-like [Lupinus angustifolius]|uniref:cytochrome P450 89A2-like n=1 Tax=Lupinus angustifolius TaxID=3871 RepID=UPI00092F5A4F|nr:PREDICTED: cytochrome P450 89A2-like [Lupinus angustifolius]